MQLELDFNREPNGQIVAFPLARNALAQRVAYRYASIRDPEERQAYWHDLYDPLVRKRLAQGLSVDQADEDVCAFGREVIRQADCIHIADIINIDGRRFQQTHHAAARLEAVGGA
jgi:hypothetical protein